MSSFVLSMMADQDAIQERNFISLLNLLQKDNCALQNGTPGGTRRSNIHADDTVLNTLRLTTISPTSGTAIQGPDSEDEQFMQALSPNKIHKFSMNALYRAAASVKTPSSVVQQKQQAAFRSLNFDDSTANSSFLLPLETENSNTPTASLTTHSSDGCLPCESKGSVAEAVAATNKSLDTDQLRGITQKPSGKWVSNQ
jgi:hypothetical protein